MPSNMERGVWTVIAIAALVAVLALGFLASRSSDQAAHASAPELPIARPVVATIARDADGGAPVGTLASNLGDASVAKRGVSAGAGAGSGAGSGSIRTVAPHLSLAMVEGFAIVNLAGGPPTIRPFGGPTPQPLRRVIGLVVDKQGQPVAGAIVLVDKTIDLQAGNIMALAGTTTDATGAFTLDRAPAVTSVAIALAGGDWSELVELAAGDPGDSPAVLHMVGHGGLTGKLTYNGHGDSFLLRLQLHPDNKFTARYETDPDGHFAIASLPPGAYTLNAGLAQAFGGGESQSIDREVVIADDHTADVDLQLVAGTTVVLTAHPPAEVTPKGIKYWLFTGPAPSSGAEARARTVAEKPPNQTVGGGLKLEPVQFHDIQPGSYQACAGLFDVRTMDALDSPFGCTPIAVHQDDTVRELDITLVAL